LIDDFDLSRFYYIKNSPDFWALAIASSYWNDEFHYLPENHRIFCKALKKRTDQYGLRLPMIFASILEHFVECLILPYCEFDADFIHELLHIQRYDLTENGADVEEWSTYPLGVFDTVNSVQGFDFSRLRALL
jgi:hypothetical protein